jgi:hypothetical protein
VSPLELEPDPDVAHVWVGRRWALKEVQTHVEFRPVLVVLDHQTVRSQSGLEDPAIGVLEDIVSTDLRHGRELATEAQSPP